MLKRITNMTKRRTCCWQIAVVLLMLGVIISPAVSAEQARVGVFECPPFVIKDGDNSYSGLSILLWQKMADLLDYEYTVESYNLDELLKGVADGEIDIGVSCLSITQDREKFLDFSHSFYETHLAIAVKEKGPLVFIGNLLTSRNVWIVILIILGAAALVGSIYYLLEHKVNDKFYSLSSPSGKILEVFMLGLLSVTKGPFSYFLFTTTAGKVITVILSIATTFFLAGITAILASSLTIQSMRSDIKHPRDLVHKEVGAITASVSSELLETHGVLHQTFDSIQDMLKALDSGEIEAILTDNAVLNYQLKKEKAAGNYRKISILPYQFAKQNYGFALKEENAIEEMLNQALLEVRKSQEWSQAIDEYFSSE